MGRHLPDDTMQHDDFPSRKLYSPIYRDLVSANERALHVTCSLPSARGAAAEMMQPRRQRAAPLPTSVGESENGAYLPQLIFPNKDLSGGEENWHCGDAMAKEKKFPFMSFK